MEILGATDWAVVILSLVIIVVIITVFIYFSPFGVAG